MNKKITIGIIGTGVISNVFLQNMAANPLFEVKVVCSRTKTRAQKYADKWNIENAIDDIAKFCKYNLDFVYVISPTSCHYQECQFLLNNNINVICEKPLVLKANEAIELHALAKKRNLFLFVAYKTVNMPFFKEIVKLLNQSGQMHSAHFVFQKPDRIFKDDITDIEHLQKPIYTPLYNAYYYLIALGYELFGSVDKDSVEALFFDPYKSGQNSVLVFQYRFSSGSILSAQTDFITNNSKAHSTIETQKSTITLDSLSSPTKLVYIDKKTLKEQTFYADDFDLSKNQSWWKPFSYEYKFFAKIFLEKDYKTCYNFFKRDLEHTIVIERIEKFNK